jgi:DNA adenine methylase
MQYMGGKGRIAKELTSVMLPMCEDRTGYLEPFVGGGFMFEQMAPHFEHRAAGDVMPDLALLWQAVAEGWIPPAEVTREQYAELRRAEPSALRAFVGFGCSFGGKWFGGYASDGNGRDYAGAAKKGIERKRAAFTGSHIRQCGYESWKFDIAKVAVYCDPPYAGTTGYSGTSGWDVERFWTWARLMSTSGAQVFVSEYDAPEGWESIWTRTVKSTLRVDGAYGTAVEHLFTWNGA